MTTILALWFSLLNNLSSGVLTLELENGALPKNVQSRNLPCGLLQGVSLSLPARCSYRP